MFAPWFEFAALPEAEFTAKASGIANQLPENPKINPLLAKAFYPPPASLKDVAESYNKLFGGIDSRWKEASEDYKLQNRRLNYKELTKVHIGPRRRKK